MSCSEVQSPRASQGGPAGHTWGQATQGGLTRRPISDLANDPTTQVFLSSLPLLPPGSSSARVNWPTAPNPAGKAEKGAQEPPSTPPTIPCTAVSPHPSRPRITRLPGAQKEVDHILEGLMSSSLLSTPLSRPPTPTSSPDPIPHISRPRQPNGDGASQTWA